MKKTILTIAIVSISVISHAQGPACSIFQTNTPQWENDTNKIFSPCPDVNVGIGISNPAEKLHVDGNVIVSQNLWSTSLKLGTSNNLFGFLTIKTPYNNGDLSLSSMPLNIANADRYLLRLNNSGLLQAREIKVDAELWPDYVFSPKYQLMPLQEVESYINMEGHLPSVPSAKEIEKDGINLGEMDKLLMEKIEELTLYIIEQEKRIAELENQLNQ